MLSKYFITFYKNSRQSTAASSQNTCPKVFYKINIKSIHPEVLFNKRCLLFKKRLRHKCFPVNFAKFSRAHFLEVNTIAKQVFFCNSSKIFITANFYIFSDFCFIICENPQFPTDWSHLLKKSLMENFISCTLLFADIQLQNILILFLFSINHSHLLEAKLLLTLALYKNGWFIGDKEYINFTLEEYNVM